MKKYLVLGGVAFFLLIAFLVTVGKYNSFVNKETAVEQSFGDLQVTYQRRNDLIPQLVKTVSAIAAQERAVFIKVTELRSQIAKMGTVDLSNASAEELAAYAALQQQMTSALSRLLVVVENYPEIRSQENFLELQAQIEGTENRINVARRDYNAVVTDYRRSIKRFPGNLFAGIFGFTDTYPLFKADEGADKVPGIDFGIPEDGSGS